MSDTKDTEIDIDIYNTSQQIHSSKEKILAKNKLKGEKIMKAKLG